MATTKKTTATKKAAASKDKAEETEETSDESGSMSVEEVAKEVIEGKWFSGRDRDILLTEAGYDPRAVQTEVAKQLSER